MAKRKAGRLTKGTSPKRPRSGKRPSAKAKSAKKAGKQTARAKPRAAAKRPTLKRTTAKKKRAAAKPVATVRAKARSAKTRKAAPRLSPAAGKNVSAPGHTSRVERERRVLSDVVQSPPSSLDMDRHGSAARTGRAEMAEHRAQRATLTPDIAGGDVDVQTEDAYFTGDESPGGDNPTPDQDVVDDIGRALGLEYNDAEELRSGEKVADRDKHRWELDPASSEDYRDRKR